MSVLARVCPRVTAALLLVLSTLAAPVQGPPLQGQEGSEDGSSALPLYTTLGQQERRISTDDRQAQAYFDQGLRLMYAYSTGLALRSFQEAQRHDPDCAMCYWGEAWARSPYLNGGMGPDAEAAAHEAIQRAKERVADRGTSAERALIDAFEVRYRPNPDGDRPARLDSAYARTMGRAALQHPEDDDLQTLWAEAMLLLRPRYEMRPLDAPDVQRIRRTLEGVLERDLRHAGACHLYIHLMEMTAEPEAAEPCADVLHDQIPGASHIQHMPSHIYMRTGRYDDAVLSNVAAWHVDQKADAGLGTVPIYSTHNLEMLVYAANWNGQSAVAVDAARRLAEQVPASEILVPQTLALFGRWDEILTSAELPEASFAEGGWRFARGLAFLRTGDRPGAEAELDRLRSLEDAVPDGRAYRGAAYPTVLSIARLLLEGEIALEAGRVNDALDHFRNAVEVEDGLAYSEPEPWHLPARRFLGAALVDAERFAEAEAVYRAALEDHVDVGWTLFGLEQALRGQDRVREADRVREQFEAAWERSDVWLTASRM